MGNLQHNFSRQISIGGRESNQDFVSNEISTNYGLLYIIADGMGGAAGGEIASQMAHDSVKSSILNATKKDSLEVVKDAIYLANKEIFSAAYAKPELNGMGTTIVVLILNGDIGYYGYIGDSRLYHFRDDQVIFCTRDHSKVYEMVAKGLITETEAETHPDSNIITKALGVSQNLTIATGDIGTLHILPNDTILMVTDGISGSLTTTGILNIVKSNPPQLSQTLVNAADEIGHKNGGGHDNMAVIAISIVKSSNRKKIFGKKNRTIKLVVTCILIISFSFLMSMYLSHENNDSDDDDENVSENCTQNLKNYFDFLQTNEKYIQRLTTDNAFKTFSIDRFGTKMKLLKDSTQSLCQQFDKIAQSRDGSQKGAIKLKLDKVYKERIMVIKMIENAYKDYRPRQTTNKVVKPKLNVDAKKKEPETDDIKDVPDGK